RSAGEQRRHSLPNLWGEQHATRQAENLAEQERLQPITQQLIAQHKTFSLE
ncbi:MAG: hypothetical protein K0Q74_1349, partial [Gammaproteobacteria bacterium]|nr:hypothetical protein [Gammaproteobacteria bacterium]